MSLLEAIQRAHVAEMERDAIEPKGYDYGSPEWAAWYAASDKLKDAQERLRDALAEALRGPR